MRDVMNEIIKKGNCIKKNVGSKTFFFYRKAVKRVIVFNVNGNFYNINYLHNSYFKYDFDFFRIIVEIMAFKGG